MEPKDQQECCQKEEKDSIKEDQPSAGDVKFIETKIKKVKKPMYLKTRNQNMHLTTIEEKKEVLDESNHSAKGIPESIKTNYKSVYEKEK